MNVSNNQNRNEKVDYIYIYNTCKIFIRLLIYLAIVCRFSKLVKKKKQNQNIYTTTSFSQTKKFL